ncbi:hypothetical protein OUO26_18880 [Chryseobacterium sp. CY350]|nr:hypothetical protein [Chryseobacterium sp. CY350]
MNPKKILKLAKSNGLKNICYQSLTEYSYYHKGEIIWVVKSCDDNKKITILEADPKTGKLLSLYKRDYYNTEKAAFWNKIPGSKARAFISTKEY